MKKLLLILIIVGGYYGYTTYQNYTTPSFIAYRNYFNALLDGDTSKAREYATGQAASLSDSYAREQFYNRGTERFSYTRVLAKDHSKDGEVARFCVKRVVRYDPPGEETFYGKESFSDLQFVTVKQVGSSWKVSSFEDTVWLK